jgi:trk system potassium uptake protein TrkA
MKVILAGQGTALFFLGRAFIAKGHEVVIINRDPAECALLARRLKAAIIQGDASDGRTLKEAGAMGADAVLAVTPHDQDNLVIGQLAGLEYGVPRVIALANDPDNAEVFEKLGLIAFSTTHLIASLIEQRASLDQVTNLLPIGEGRVNVTELVLEERSPAAGKSLGELNLPENALVAVVLRDHKPIIPRGPTIIRPGDRLVLITLPENHGPVLKRFTNET